MWTEVVDPPTRVQRWALSTRVVVGAGAVDSTSLAPTPLAHSPAANSHLGVNDEPAPRKWSPSLPCGWVRQTR